MDLSNSVWMGSMKWCIIELCARGPYHCLKNTQWQSLAERAQGDARSSPPELRIDPFHFIHSRQYLLPSSFLPVLQQRGILEYITDTFMTTVNPVLPLQKLDAGLTPTFSDCFKVVLPSGDPTATPGFVVQHSFGKVDYPDHEWLLNIEQRQGIYSKIWKNTTIIANWPKHKGPLFYPVQLQLPLLLLTLPLPLFDQ